MTSAASHLLASIVTPERFTSQCQQRGEFYVGKFLMVVKQGKRKAGRALEEVVRSALKHEDAGDDVADQEEESQESERSESEEDSGAELPYRASDENWPYIKG